MIFGMPTLIELPDINSAASLAKELGLSFIELNMNLPKYQADRLEKSITELILCGEKYGVFLTIHLDEKLNVCDFNEDVRNAYLKTVARSINVAKQLDVPILNMHINHGVHFTLPDKKVRLFDIYKDNYLQSVSDFKKMCEKEIGKSNIKICIENTNGFFGYEKEAISLLLESEKFALTWDIGHSNAVQNIDEEFIMANESRLTHFHIHDGKENADHLTLGSGEIDLKQRLSVAEKHNCSCVVETKTVKALEESMKWLFENGYIKEM